jgi:hypothetical protein
MLPVKRKFKQDSAADNSRRKQPQSYASQKLLNQVHKYLYAVLLLHSCQKNIRQK